MGVDLDKTGSSDLTALHRAILSGHQDLLLEPLIEHGADVNAISADFGTPLCLAALKGMDEAVNLLLRSRANASIVTGKLGSALHCCVLSVGDHKDTAVALIGAGASVAAQARIDTRWLCAIYTWNGDDRTSIASKECFNGCILSNATPALMAISTQQEHLLELLLPSDLDQRFTTESRTATSTMPSEGRDIHLRSQKLMDAVQMFGSSGYTYLMSCTSLGQLQSVMLLVSKGASLDLASSTPMHLAVLHGHIEVVELLIQSGVPIGTDWTALHEAARAGKPDMIRLLCKYGASVNARTSVGDRPMHLAALLFSRTFGDAYLHSLQALIQAGSDVNARDGRGRTPLLLALQAGNILGPASGMSYMQLDGQHEELDEQMAPFFFKELIQAGADTRLRAADGTSVVKLIMANSTTRSLFKALVQGKGFDETLLNRAYSTICSFQDFRPKHLTEVELVNVCAKTGHEDLRLFTLLGGNLDDDGSCGWTAMHCAAEENDCIAIDRLLAAGALLEPPTEFVTPLGIAVKGKCLNAVRMLLDRGADPLEHRESFQNAIEITIGQGKSELLTLNLLRKAAANFSNPAQEHSSEREAPETSGKVVRLQPKFLRREAAGATVEKVKVVQSIWERPTQITRSKKFIAQAEDST